jgi:uncharacterized membrane protein (UPF0127 family)
MDHLRRWLIIAAVFLYIGIIIMLGARANFRHPVTLTLGNQAITLDQAASELAKHRGLGGRDSMPQNRGMLFSFTEADTYCFWMKNMRFPLDIIWVNSHNEVVSIEHNVSPDTYPETFCPSEPAQYVIELNAGQAQLHDIKVGALLNF